MSTLDAALASWSVSGWSASSLVLAAIIYARGWHALHAQMPARFPRWRLLAFLSGLAILFAAIASPLDAFAFLLLPVHMTQHVLLLAVAPPLLLLAWPAHPLLRGLPSAIAKAVLGPFLAWPALRSFGSRLVHPIVASLVMTIAIWGWHVPAVFEAALRVPALHAAEHASFFVAGLLFWWPVIQPWPSRAQISRWAIVPYLLVADLQNTALAALLVFSDRVLYPSYANVPRLGSLSVLDEQALAGLLMWVPMSLAYLVPAGAITLRLLSPRRESAASPERIALRPTAVRLRSFDLLAVPWLGAIIRSQRARRLAQGFAFVVAVAVIVDGLFGTEVAPLNLAGVVPWTYWRGATVVGLLVLGNVFCPICPFMGARDVARLLHVPQRPFPRALRSKWLALALLFVLLWWTESRSLWNDPVAVAWLVVAYFAAALAVDSVFAGASFCKYVCPIGQFQFVQSLASPFEVAVKHPQRCAACATRDCLHGNDRARGCELELLAPRKLGGVDCTGCLDCVRACPHDNIGLLAGVPARAVLRDPDRSSLGRLSRRPDVAALTLVVVFGAFASALAMTGRMPSLAFAAGVGAAPFGLALLAGWLARRAARSDLPLQTLVCRFALALIPLGLAMWAAHLGLHLVAGWRSVVPVLQGLAPRMLGAPDLNWCRPGIEGDHLIGSELLLLDLGLLLSLWAAWRIATTLARRAAPAIALAAPWGLLAIALWTVGVWSVFQPMQMRGLLGGG